MKPLLAASMVKKAAEFTDEQLTQQLQKLEYPVYCSPKIDGIRVMLHGDPQCENKSYKALTRSLKPVRNKFVQSCLTKPLLDQFGKPISEKPALRYMDGEVLVRTLKTHGKKKNAKTEFQATTSGVMSVEGEPDFHYFIFDYMFSPDLPFADRLLNAETIINRMKAYDHEIAERISLLPHELIYSAAAVLKYERKMLHAGYEGIMIRDPMGIYKFGRSTFNEGILIKMKRFTDAEASVIGFEPKYTNTNDSFVNELGNTARSTDRSGLVEEDTLGALIVQGFSGQFKGVKFRIGSGFDDALRKKIWMNKDDYLGKIVSYNYQPYNIKDAPRFPVYKGFRDGDDMDASVGELDACN